ncbi:MAG TPA: dienelactone hydrolase family protein [Actinomycetota bacterium]
MGEMVSFESNGGTAQGYLAGDGPGIVVIQEWWGLNDQIKGVCDDFAAEGFTALAPDFYHGSLATEPDEAGKLMMALDIDRTAADARGAAAFLAGQTGGRVGVIGFCMGGQLALLAGTVAPEHVGAVVDMYGIHPALTPDYSKMNAPVLGLFAEHDDFVTQQVRDVLSAELSKHGIDHEFHVYPGTHHAFTNETRSDVYDRGASQDARGRTLEFFRKNLG